MRGTTGRLRRALCGGAGIAGALTLTLACTPWSSHQVAKPDEADIGGPIQSSPESGTNCLQTRPGSPHPYTMGFNIVTNTGNEPAEVNEVHLKAPEGLSIEEAWLVPTDGGAVGDNSTFPPPARVIGAAGLDWNHRETIPGAKAAAGVRYNLVLHLRSTSTHPSTKGIGLTYAVNGKEYGWQTQMGLVVDDVC